MVSPDVVDIGSEYSVVYLSCVYIYIYISVCSAGYACCSVVSTSMLSLVSHAAQNEKKLEVYTVIGEVLVLGLLVVY